MRLSIRYLLTLWYAAVVGFNMLLLGLGIYFSASWSFQQVTDSELTSGIESIATFLRHKYATHDIKHLDIELREHSSLLPKGKLTRISYVRGGVLFQSSGMQQLSTLAAAANGNTSILDTQLDGRSIRFFSRVAKAGPDYFLIEIGVDHTDYLHMLRRLEWVLGLSVPAAMVLAALSGYWMSGRALTPVHRITSTASRIDAQNLELRLPLRGTNDELDGLSKTLNSMFDRIEAAYARVTQFTADASHELRTPVALIRANAEYLLMEPLDAARIRRGIADILKQSEYMTRLIEDLLMLARTDRGSDSATGELFDLKESLAEVVARANTLAAAKNIQVEYQPTPHVVAIRGHRTEFQRLAMIFIDNAIRYSPECTQITLTTWTNDKECGFAVLDHGIGIPMEHQEHIFQRFYRVDAARTPHDSGTGLGLAIAMGLIASHGGKVTVRSEPGRGSCFTVSLPRADAEQHSGVKMQLTV